jgi:hypothetical protein
MRNIICLAMYSEIDMYSERVKFFIPLFLVLIPLGAVNDRSETHNIIKNSGMKYIIYLGVHIYLGCGSNFVGTR